jgi:hypothetical protein
MTNWQRLVIQEMSTRDETPIDIVASNPKWEELEKIECDRIFNLWTTNYVYFPQYSFGCNFVCSVPRNPDNAEIIN